MLRALPDAKGTLEESPRPASTPASSGTALLARPSLATVAPGLLISNAGLVGLQSVLRLAERRRPDGLVLSLGRAAVEERVPAETPARTADELARAGLGARFAVGDAGGRRGLGGVDLAEGGLTLLLLLGDVASAVEEGVAGDRARDALDKVAGAGARAAETLRRGVGGGGIGQVMRNIGCVALGEGVALGVDGRSVGGGVGGRRIVDGGWDRITCGVSWT